jgi:RNA polymerase sigma-70 factor (ECF subfamily)
MSSETAQLSPLYPDDLTLAAALKDRETNAGEEFVRRFGSTAFATARRFLQSDSDCEDAVQESFLSAVQSIGTFKGNSALGTWLHRIVVNVCLMKLRSRAPQPSLSIDALLPTFDTSGRHMQAVRRWKSAPDHRLLREETRELVRRCIDMLPDDHRTVLILRDIEELSTQETAEILRATPGIVKTRLHRARQALRSLLEPHFP